MTAFQRPRPSDFEAGSVRHTASFADINLAVSRLFTDATPDVGTVTSRSAHEYVRILGLQDRPPRTDAAVLDVGSGKAALDPKTLGIATLTRVDLEPQSPTIDRGFASSLPYDDARFDEVWAMFSLRYLDMRPPLHVERQLGERADRLALNTLEVRDHFRELAGLLALSELLRVTAADGLIRVGSYQHDFEQGGAWKRFLHFVLVDKLPGLSIGGTEVRQTNEVAEMNLFIAKNRSFDIATLRAAVTSTLPAELAAVLRLNPDISGS